MAKPRKDHYIPAALIGGFGEPATSGRLREATVAVWFNKSGSLKCIKAEDVGFRRGLYRIDSVAGSDEDFDDLWALYEGGLPDAIRHLEDEEPSSHDLNVLAAHVAFAGARYVGFSDSLIQWSRAQGIELTTDEAQSQRPAWIQGGLQVVDWRWRTLHAPNRSAFVLPDTGYALVKKTVHDPYYVFLPLSPRVGLLVKRPEGDEPRGLASIDYRQLTWTAGDLLNEASAAVPDRTVLISHPARADELERLATSPQPDRKVKWLGPYVGRKEDWF